MPSDMQPTKSEAKVRNIKRRRNPLPPWDMPTDPVRAVFWFVQWLLRVLVRFFWILILVGVLYEGILNGKSYGIFNGFFSGFVTLLIGLGVWAALSVALFLFNASLGISKTLSDVNQMHQRMTQTQENPFATFTQADRENRVVEGSITDLEEERRKRRSE